MSAFDPKQTLPCAAARAYIVPSLDARQSRFQLRTPVMVLLIAGLVFALSAE
jgi:hypothetical protein